MYVCMYVCACVYVCVCECVTHPHTPPCQVPHYVTLSHIVIKVQHNVTDNIGVLVALPMALNYKWVYPWPDNCRAGYA